MNNRYPVKLPAVAAIAFVVAVFSSTPLPVMAVVAYAVLAERDLWLVRQTLCAFWISVLFSLLHRFSTVLAEIGAASLPLMALTDFFATIVWLLRLLVIAASFFGLLRVVRSKDARLPLLSALSDWCVGKAQGASASPPPSPQQTPQLRNPERRDASSAEPSSDGRDLS